MFTDLNPSCITYSDRHRVPNDSHASILDGAVYGSDEFRMFNFKINRCVKTRSHDWTECPFAHRGERARRRDPNNYLAIACPEFRNGGVCPRGKACLFAHGVFEFWLHPAKYRTRPCTSGLVCDRKVCFFAHTPLQLRHETKYRCNYMCGHHAAAETNDNKDNQSLDSATPYHNNDKKLYDSAETNDNKDNQSLDSAAPYHNIDKKLYESVAAEFDDHENTRSSNSAAQNHNKAKKMYDYGNFMEGGELEFVKSLRELKIGDGKSMYGFGSDLDCPRVDWISDLVN